MKTLRVVSDGQGCPRLESLALPFLAQGPTVTSQDVERSPAPTTTAAVRWARPASTPAGRLETVRGTSSRRLFLVISGLIEVVAPYMQATLGPGDVLFLDVLGQLTEPAVLSAATPCSYVEVEVDAEWSPIGTVPPYIDEGRRTRRTAPTVLRVESDGERAHLVPFDELFTQAATPPQDVEALTFMCLSPAMTSDWHTEPGVSLVVVLAGGFEIEVGGDGGRRTLRAGDVCLVEDFEGQGHKSSMDGETRFAALRLPQNHQWTRDADNGRTKG